MTTQELLTAIRDALAADTALEAWCQEQFVKSATILLGLDERDPPGENDYPLVAIVGCTQERGDMARELSWKVFVGVGVVNEEIVIETNTKTATGLLQAEELRELAENAIYRARIASGASAGEASTESYYPLFVSYTTITFTALRTTQRGLP
jgi:hypothetical protein